MSDAAIAVRLQGVSKEFARRRTQRTLLRALRSLTSANGGAGPRRLSLDGIDVEVSAGDLIGIVGENGAGKTTLLKTIAGLYVPTAGSVQVHGEIALLAGLGAGMIDDLTVADNIWLYGAVCRIRRSTIREHFNDVLSWAELEGYEAAELRTLSTGMRTRLAFSIAMRIESNTVLMDEAFSAGDKRFQAKCDRFFEESKGSGKTVLVATHNLEFVRRFCDRTMWLHRGRLMGFGRTEEVLGKYLGYETK
jgi:ABC-type polysaccharide/polyol phosphate transport system ATPase subunit